MNLELLPGTAIVIRHFVTYVIVKTARLWLQKYTYFETTEDATRYVTGYSHLISNQQT